MDRGREPFRANCVLFFIFLFYSLGKATSISRRSRFIQVLFLPALIGLVLCISGGTDQSSASASTRATGTREFKAGLVLFITMYVLLALLTLISVGDSDVLHQSLEGSSSPSYLSCLS